MKADSRESHRRQPQRLAFASRRRRVGTWLGVGLLSAAIFAGIFGVIASQPRPRLPAAAVSGVVGTQVGDTAPDFRLVDINGVIVTRRSLVAERPGLLFFRATWCLPCIEGLKHLMKFQQDIGGIPFNVLIVFVDPQESDNDLRAYRDRFGFSKTWHYCRGVT